MGTHVEHPAEDYKRTQHSGGGTTPCIANWSKSIKPEAKFNRHELHYSSAVYKPRRSDTPTASRPIFPKQDVWHISAGPQPLIVRFRDNFIRSDSQLVCAGLFRAGALLSGNGRAEEVSRTIWCRYNTATRLRTQFGLDVVRVKSIASRRPPPGFVHHSDRGGQHARHDHRAMFRRTDSRQA